MAYKVKLVFSDEEIEIEGTFDTEEEAEKAALYEISCLHQGREDIAMMGGDEEDIGDEEPEIEIWEE